MARDELTEPLLSPEDSGDSKEMPTTMAQSESRNYMRVMMSYHNMINGWAKEVESVQDPETIQAAKSRINTTLDNALDKMMLAQTANELYFSHQSLLKVYDSLDENHELDSSQVKELKRQTNELYQQRKQYYGKATKEKKPNRTRLKFAIGGTIICGALAATVVGAPLIPSAALGLAALAYGASDVKEDITDSIEENKHEIDPRLTGHDKDSLDKVKSELKTQHLIDSTEDVSHKASEQKIKAISDKYQPSSQSIKKSKDKLEKRHERKSKIKKYAKWLGVAGGALAVAALIAVFPPVGIPAAAGIAIGVASVATIGVAGTVVAKGHFDSRKESKIAEREQQAHFDETAAELESIKSSMETPTSDQSSDAMMANAHIAETSFSSGDTSSEARAELLEHPPTEAIQRSQTDSTTLSIDESLSDRAITEHSERHVGGEEEGGESDRESGEINDGEEDSDTLHM